MTPLRSDPSSSSSHTPLYSARHTPSKLLVTLRRSFSKPKEREPPHPAPAHRYRADRAAARPTIEQIAMGLHVSRTPHIPAHLAHLHLHAHTHTHIHTHTVSSRSASPSPRSLSPRRPSTAPPLPPPPARSALKQPMTAQSSSLTTLDTATSLSTAASSTAPPTPSSARPRWGRLLFGRRASASVVGPPAERKAVRFEEVLRVGSESEGEGTS